VEIVITLRNKAERLQAELEASRQREQELAGVLRELYEEARHDDFVKLLPHYGSIMSKAEELLKGRQ
jgi:hypothetical protein